jgi:tRNA G18 (ribose-2'-O)-methylase SpoU
MVPQVIKVRTRNNVYQHIEVLKRNREKRTRYKRFFVEGVKSINRLVSNKWQIQSLVYSPDVPMSNWAKEILRTAGAKEHIEMPANLLAELSDKEEPSELLAVVPMPEDDLSRIKLHGKLNVVLFDRPSSHGNLGTIIRTCDSFKADGMIITGHCVDLYDPQTIRASVGSLFTVPVIRMPSHKELIPWLSQIRSKWPDFHIVGSDEKAEVDIIDHDFTGPTAFVLGNETDGMSRSYKELCDRIIKIPIYGSASSLNVACAASILLYEIDRQRRTKGSMA